MTADKFRNWRLDLGWTQADAAQHLDISISAVADYEKGTKRSTDRPAPVPRAIELACETLSRRHVEAGWAEGVATPDEDVGFVFTMLEPDFTGLPVRLWVGDDTPLIVAAPRLLSDADVAAIRRWVVRHQGPLNKHWHKEIDSGGLFDLLQDMT